MAHKQLKLLKGSLSTRVGYCILPVSLGFLDLGFLFRCFRIFDIFSKCRYIADDTVSLCIDNGVADPLVLQLYALPQTSEAHTLGITTKRDSTFPGQKTVIECL